MFLCVKYKYKLLNILQNINGNNILSLGIEKNGVDWLAVYHVTYKMNLAYEVERSAILIV